ncbi:hypothetical protein LCGC14_2093400 [marine sediment metagenome]|uniref:Uncharacterized protein n=1 Tax=marine sediment metagenome TaxID=412755 RepID=A0A0F9EC98_9ZZZZ
MGEQDVYIVKVVGSTPMSPTKLIESLNLSGPTTI